MSPDLLASLTKDGPSGKSLNPYELVGRERVTLHLVQRNGEILAFNGRVEEEILINTQVGYVSIVIYLTRQNDEAQIGEVRIHPIMRLFLRLVPLKQTGDEAEDAFYFQSRVALMTEGAL